MVKMKETKPRTGFNSESEYLEQFTEPIRKNKNKYVIINSVINLIVFVLIFFDWNKQEQKETKLLNTIYSDSLIISKQRQIISDIQNKTVEIPITLSYVHKKFNGRKMANGMRADFNHNYAAASREFMNKYGNFGDSLKTNVGWVWLTDLMAESEHGLRIDIYQTPPKNLSNNYQKGKILTIKSK